MSHRFSTRSHERPSRRPSRLRMRNIPRQQPQRHRRSLHFSLQPTAAPILGPFHTQVLISSVGPPQLPHTLGLRSCFLSHQSLGCQCLGSAMMPARTWGPRDILSIPSMSATGSRMLEFRVLKCPPWVVSTTTMFQVEVSVKLHDQVRRHTMPRLPPCLAREVRLEQIMRQHLSS
jgi:hypothetical protein